MLSVMVCVDKDLFVVERRVAAMGCRSLSRPVQVSTATSIISLISFKKTSVTLREEGCALGAGCLGPAALLQRSVGSILFFESVLPYLVFSVPIAAQTLLMRHFDQRVVDTVHGSLHKEVYVYLDTHGHTARVLDDGVDHAIQE